MSKLVIETDADAFLRSIGQWDDAAPPFNEIMPSALLLWTLHDGPSDTFFRALAYEFEFGRSFVRRWVSGASKPHLLVQRHVVQFVREILEKRVARCRKARAKAYAAWRQLNRALQALENEDD